MAVATDGRKSQPRRAGERDVEFVLSRSPINLANLVTVGRLLMVVPLVWLIVAENLLAAFWLFVAAGISDALDGFIAKRFNARTNLGSYLDPLADKALIVSIYIALGIVQALPRWFVILVVSRDIMIVAAVMLSWVVAKPVAMKPLAVSKANTAAQIILATAVLAALGLAFQADWLIWLGIAVVTALTLLSIAAYVREWVRHMGSA
jgi:cardiolipin synthase